MKENFFLGGRGEFGYGGMGRGFESNWIFMLAVYLYLAFCLYKIAKKQKAKNAWFAWVPILNIILILEIAKKPIWWLILLCIPFVNIIVGIIVLIGFLNTLKKPDWWAILLLIPVVNLFAWGMLAFKKK
ncbi:hypothetical protein KKC32_04250 [Patescibacteria group bacterium]|nr:hypothetical protein [Patescibacteria group bacterium]